jgi:ribosomal protein L29
MNPEDLRIKERETREEIFRLRLRLRTNQLDKPANYRKARKELARIMTLLGQSAAAAVKVAAASKKVSDARAD